MPTTLDLTGLDKRIQQLHQLDDAKASLNAAPLMLTWMRIIDEDNRRGILAGTDKDGVALAPVTYRPKHPGPIKPNKSQRGGRKTNAQKGAFQGLGYVSHGNLSSAEYRLLGGPPLAPRDQFSRVITNLKVTFGGPNTGAPQWFAQGAWDEVVDVQGIPFLHWHFDGIGQKRRDLRGVRPQGVAKAMDALRNWARLAVRELFS
jgi:hypothetical protein